MSLAYVEKLGLKTRKTNVKAQKIDGSALEIFGIVIADIQIENKGGRLRFFQKAFLVADTKFKMILGMLFLKISNANVVFNEETLTWKLYITNKVLPTTEQVQLVNPKIFVLAALDTDSEIFVMHVTIREQEEMVVNPGKKVQIETQSRAQVGALLFNKAPIEVSAEYSDYSNVFSAKNVAELPENTGINEHAIKLEKSRQPPFGPIYSLGPVELEIWKIYIENNLAYDFIRPFKFPMGALILFNRKPDRSFCLCVYY